MKSASSTEVRKTLRPGQPGTRRLQREWGSRLVCVRHRVDPERGVRFTTVEIVVSAERTARVRRLHPEALVYARVGDNDRSLLKRLIDTRAATYDSYLGIWTMQYATAIRLGLGRRLLLRRPKPSWHARPGNSNIHGHRFPAIPAHLRQNPPKLE